MMALLFSTVTTSGRASVCVLRWEDSAWSARLMLNRRPTIPNASPVVGAPVALGRAAIGRFTRLPPSGRPLVALIGSRFVSVKFGFGGGPIPTGAIPPAAVAAEP